MKKNTNKKPFIATRKRMDNSVEVILQKSPSKTTLGKILLFLVVAGTILLPVALLIYELVTK
jgi:hypothetical protein